MKPEHLGDLKLNKMKQEKSEYREYQVMARG